MSTAGKDHQIASERYHMTQSSGDVFRKASAAVASISYWRAPFDATVSAFKGTIFTTFAATIATLGKFKLFKVVG